MPRGVNIMPVPKSVMKMNKKDGVTFISNVDRAQYTIKELSRAALKDVAKFIKKSMIVEMKKLPGMRRSRRPSKAVGSWVRPMEGDLQIGFGHTKKGTSGDTWYGIQQELGSENQPKRAIMRSTVYDNIPMIIKIESQYLSALENEARALSLIDESGEVENGE